MGVNHLGGNSESLWQSVSPTFFGAANYIWPIANQFSNRFTKRPFLVLSPLSLLFRQNFSSLDKFYEQDAKCE